MKTSHLSRPRVGQRSRPSSDGAPLAESVAEGGALYSVATRERTSMLSGPMQGVHGVAFSSDGRRLLTASGGPEAVKIWDLATRHELLKLPGKGSLLYSVQLIENVSTVLIGDNSAGIWQLWRAPSWETIQKTESAGGGWHGEENP